MTIATTTDWFFLLLLLLLRSVAAGQNVNDDDMVVTHVYVWASAAETVYAYGICLDVLWKFIAFVSLIRMSAIEHAFRCSEHGTQHAVKKKSYARARARVCVYENFYSNENRLRLSRNATILAFNIVYIKFIMINRSRYSPIPFDSHRTHNYTRK